MSTEHLYFSALALFFAGMLPPFFLKLNNSFINVSAHGMAASGSIAGVLCAVSVFTGGSWQMAVPLPAPVGSVTFAIDALSAIFILALGLVGAAACIYAVGYTTEYYRNRFRQLAGLFNAFLLSMLLVFSVSHAFAFLIAWELMAVVSFLLVIHDHHDAENVRAGYIYMLMTQLGTVFVATAFFLLAARAGSLDFGRMAALELDSRTAGLVFLASFIGFGTKAGMVPLHIWLPRAHPAAPSHVSALMSGIMIKTAIYGMARFYFDFLGTGPLWWGGIVLAVGVVSAVMGVLYALMENDLKRLLAYSSVENIGLILLGIGAGLVFAAGGKPGLAALAWTAALYHTVAHAVFKSLLFLGAGSVVFSTHTKNMEALGGLIKLMPYTAIVFLFGAAAIAALPPLSGFVSEWLTFQSLFLLPQALDGIKAKVAGAALVAVLGLTGALAAACFVKAFGIIFLAKPRSEHARYAEETPAVMWSAAGLLAGLCLVLGLFPQPLLAAISRVFAGKAGYDASVLQAGNWYTIAFRQADAGGALTPMGVFVLLIAGAVIAFAIFRFRGKPSIIGGETWTCGIVPDARMEYTGTGFSKPVRVAFRFILRPQRETLVREGGKYHGRKLSYHLSIRYIFNELYRPLNQSIIRVATKMKRIQTGSVQLYIGYLAAVTILVLVWNAWWLN
ncbi:MAG: hydrogenase 4 subunit B [Negativicutes bacterium]|nr:hydrogenase 4 subunit B [Negativicutes bacterium]